MQHLAQRALSSYGLTGILVLAAALAAIQAIRSPADGRDFGTAAGLLIAVVGQLAGATVARRSARASERSLCRQVDAAVRRYHSALTALSESERRMSEFERVYRRSPEPSAARQLEIAEHDFDTCWATVTATRDSLLDTLAEAKGELPGRLSTAVARLQRDVAPEGASPGTSASPISDAALAEFHTTMLRHAHAAT